MLVANPSCPAQPLAYAGQTPPLAMHVLGMPELHPFIAELLQIEPPKTWSLIATMFGDLDGDALSGKQIGALLGNVGIKPEASRVALHRLRHDGWIVSHKFGREVNYALSDRGRTETVAAQKDVYRRDVKFADGWQVCALDPDHAGHSAEGVLLGRNLILLPKRENIENALTLSLGDGPLPGWVEACLVPTHLLKQAAALGDLAERFDPLEGQLTSADITTMRLLFIHYWRKMALRMGVWAHIGLLSDGDMARCHRAVTDLLSKTPKISPPEV